MATRPRSVSLQLSTKNQTLDSLHALLAKIGGMAGCSHCGQLAFMHIDIIGDPPTDDLVKIGVTGINIQH